jgi:hypothetical protein
MEAMMRLIMQLCWAMVTAEKSGAKTKKMSECLFDIQANQVVLEGEKCP